MPKNSTEILTKHQKEVLAQFLELARDKEEDLTLTELEGFLFGLVITPDPIMPSEWMAEIFGGAMPEFESTAQLEMFFKTLLDAYNAYSDAFYKERLYFPFIDLKAEDISEEVMNEMAEWTHGFLVALRLRPEIWYLDYEYEKAPEYIKGVLLSLAIVHGVVNPEESHELFETEDGTPVDENLNTALMFGSLPLAIETLKDYGRLLWEERVEAMKKGVFDFNTEKVKIGRNDPCPCGSGKKYKKCCGKN
ncbi:MAG: UPF0149 family protein [Thermodesulfovibrionales bacterium]